MLNYQKNEKIKNGKKTKIAVIRFFFQKKKQNKLSKENHRNFDE